jgi:hypothetical protein
MFINIYLKVSEVLVSLVLLREGYENVPTRTVPRVVFLLHHFIRSSRLHIPAAREIFISLQDSNRRDWES